MSADIKDIYNRMPSDIRYIPQVETSDEIEILLGRIRMCLGTRPGDVMGSPGFGVDLKQYIFKYGLDVNELQQYIMAHINIYVNYDPERFNISVEVNYGKDHINHSDYAVIDIIINSTKYMGVIVK